MARYIDIEPYDDCFITLHKEDNGVSCKMILTADVVEVKRCKDCAYHTVGIYAKLKDGTELKIIFAEAEKGKRNDYMC